VNGFSGDTRGGPPVQPGRRRPPQLGDARAGEPHEATLQVRGLNASYGTSHVLFDVDLDVRAGETVALIGRNGAGKTTALHSLMGMVARRSGSVRIDGEETIALAPHRIARLGVGLVPEGRRVFGELTVEENLQVAVRGGARERRWTQEEVFDVFPLLANVRRSKGAWLSGGEQQVLAIARALVGEPRLLLLDEPTEGLAPRVVETLGEQLRRVQRTGLAMLLAEQHMGLVGELAARAYVIDRGVIRYEGAPAELLGDEEIRRAHLSL
jgi:branched-chain amino acid transport system ATP-binding protein